MVWGFGPEACGILAPWLGTEPNTSYIGRWSLNHWTTTEIPRFLKIRLEHNWKKALDIR